MKQVFRFFAERNMFANLFTIMILLMGAGALMQIKRDQFPIVDIGQMLIFTVYPGASPEDVELNVTNKIEEELKEVTGIKELTSVSFENSSSILVELDPDADNPGEVKDEIRRAVQRVSDLPADVTESPIILEIKTPFNPFIEIGISGDIPYPELREAARLFEKKLKSVDGVSRTQRYGYRYREVKVAVDPEKLKKYQLPLREIIMAIQGRNIRATGGSLESYTSEKNVVTLSQFKKPAEVGDVIIRSTFDGPLVRVRDVAAIVDDFEDEELISRVNGHKAISFSVFNKPSADVIRTVDRVKALIEKEQKNMPRGVKIVWSSDLSTGVRNQFRIVLSNGGIGLVLVIILLALFLNVRTAFWVAIGIPVTFLGVSILLPFFGAYMDTIVLTSMVIVIGIIVDDAIIVSESIYKHREMGLPPLEAGVEGLYAVYKPVLVTVLTTFIAFAPMFFMPGMLGMFVYVIPLTVGLALFISMAEVSVALPAHLVHGFSLARPGAAADHSFGWFDNIRLRFNKTMVWPIRLRYFTILLFLAAFAASMYYAATYMKFVLFPSKGSERFYITVETPIGSSLEASLDVMKKIEVIVESMEENELQSYVTRIGLLLRLDGPPRHCPNCGTMIIDLTPWSHRNRSADQIVEALRAKARKVHGVKEILFAVESGGPPTGKPVNVRIIGSDDTMRKKLTDNVTQFLEGIDGVKDISRGDIAGKEQVEVVIDYTKLARLGLTVADVSRNLRVAYDGEHVTSVRYGEEDVEFRVILNEKARRKLSYLESLQIPNNLGRLIALEEVAKLKLSPGPSDVHHFDRERTTTVSADLAQEKTTALEVTNAIQKKFDLDKDYPGMRFMIGGEAQETESSMKSLFISFGLAAIGIYFLLMLLFNSPTQPIIVLMAIPFGMIGVVIAFALHQETFGFLAMLGVIGMAGVVVNDSLVLVNHINEQRRRFPETKILRLVVEATGDRLRAILMTTATTVAGLLPLAYGIGGTDIYMGPMALALGFGLLFATPLTLLLVPSLYLVGDDISRLFGYLIGKIKRKSPDVETA
ncbi:MAG: efflux RND transporter permease subunit [Nitrospinota bacterium]|nr:efflux RND transporter permease subunit [Nitrospinota bacterium]